MRSWQLLSLPALITCAAASCYFPGGLEADEEWVPCNKVDGFSVCCQDGDTCLDSGLCLTAGGPRTGACQNSDWAGCHPDLSAAVELKARQETVIVDGGGGAPSTVIVIATATQTIATATQVQTANFGTVDPTSEPTVSATAEPTKAADDDKKTNLAPIIGGAAGGAVLLLSIAGIFFYCRRRKKLKRRLEAEIRASIQSDWLGQMEVGSGKREPQLPQVMEVSPQEKPRLPPPGGSGGNIGAKMDDGRRLGSPIHMDHGVQAVEIDDGRRMDIPTEMESPPPHNRTSPHQPPWVVPKDRLYEIG
ncbi:hypothetical protein B0T10DRAFT_84700 [Thelonectria olida]|uniref:Uncharacterized protein n=1 Tax=Thelonectria olida TaxID=1576542 RepID=A0A9P9AMZ9_9HYPO|nr:hypothetical protein B0T10DRAFT_84700 [Thelonectria olida]